MASIYGSCDRRTTAGRIFRRNKRMQPTFELRTLGALTLSRAGTPIETLGSKRLVFLAMLASSGQDGIPREQLGALFWPESDDERARAALHQLTYVFRRTLGEAAVNVGPTHLRIDEQLVDTDVASFTKAIQEQRYRDAVDRYAGPFLDGVRVGSAELERRIDETRARLARLHIRALSALREAGIARGDYADAARWARQVFAADRANGAATVALMEVLAAMHETVAALQVADQHSSWMRVELDLPPDNRVLAFAAKLRMNASMPVEVPAESVAPRITPVDVVAPRISAPVVAPAPTTRPRRRPFYALAAAGIAIVGVIAAAIRSQPSRAASAADATPVVAVTPFRISAPDSSLAYLHDGMVDLLSAKVSGEGFVRAVTPATSIATWTKLRNGLGHDPTDADLASLAQSTGAGRVITGSIIASGEVVTLQAALVDARNMNRVSSAEVTGPRRDLPTLVDRLAAQLLSIEAGAGAARLPMFANTPLAAVQAYVEGRAAFRVTDFRRAFDSFQQAVAQDSTFALAALDLVRAAGWLSERDERRRAQRLAWTHRDRLPTADRALLTAIVGPRYPAPSDMREKVAAWDRVTQLIPDQADSWFELGDQLFHAGQILGDAYAERRTAASLAAAYPIDPAYGPALVHALQYAAAAGDSATVRQLADRAAGAGRSDGESGFVRWRVALLFDDAGELARLRAGFDSLESRSLVSISLAALFDAVAIADARRALETLARRSAISVEREEAIAGLHAVALSRGRPNEAAALLPELPREGADHDGGLHLQVLDAIFAGGDSSVADRASDALSASGLSLESSEARATGRDYDAESRMLRNQVLATCSAAQWRVVRGRLREASDATVLLRRLSTALNRQPEADQRMSDEARVCALLIDAWSLVQRHALGARDSVVVLDSLRARGPDIHARLDAELPLIIARLYDSLGEPGKALRAVRRRGYFNRWPHYQSETLQLEMKLALAVRDTSGAIAAARAYLALHDAPEPSVAPTVAAVRAQLKRLSR
jgi:DNA-binding SARP family transcriptional activator/TolB-like protein